MLAIYKREVRSYFNSMIGCVFAAFLTIIGGVYFMVYNLIVVIHFLPTLWQALFSCY